MAQSLFIGVDGGGTNCRARIRDDAGRLLGEGSGGPANARLGVRAFAAVLAACRAAAGAAKLGEDDLARAHAGLGLAGVAQPIDRDFILAQPHPFASLVLDTDAYAAWLGAFDGADGAILILGTGSCGLAVVRGKRFNVSGWGDQISDEASGMAIGRMAIRRSIWALEGMAPLTPFAEAVLDKFDRRPDAAVTWAESAKPADYARFAPTAFDYAGKGDRLAVTVIEEAASDAARMIRRLLEIGAPAVALVGGVAGALKAWLPPEFGGRLVEPASDALDGAILMARQALGVGERVG